MDEVGEVGLRNQRRHGIVVTHETMRAERDGGAGKMRHRLLPIDPSVFT